MRLQRWIEASVLAAAIGLAALDGALAQSSGDAPPGVPGGPGDLGGPRLKLDELDIALTPESKGRGAPLPSRPMTIVGAEMKGLEGGFGAATPGRAVAAAQNGDVPEGVTPLDHDIFSTTDFYADRDLWMDPRYYRCNSPQGIENSWGALEAPSIGDDFPRTVAWGYCDRDYPRDQIVSPYAYETAQEHYEALVAEAKSRGGPTQYSRDNMPPEWDGVYLVGGFDTFLSNRTWMTGSLAQIPTYLSLLTLEYQQRFVQMMYHEGHGELVWPGAYCWPDGFERRWYGAFNWILVAPSMVQFRNVLNEPLVTDVFIGKQFNMEGSSPNLSGDRRQYMGDTIGFWDGDALITWTSNIKGWVAHGMFETSDDLQAVEIYTPISDQQAKLVGLLHETILYDPQAFVEPLRVVEPWQRLSGIADAGRPVGSDKCSPTLFPIDGQQTPVSPGDTITYTVPDFSGRPWDDIWATYFEKDMQRPEEEDVLEGFQ